MGQQIHLYSDDDWAPIGSDELLRLAVQVGGIGVYDTDFVRNRTRFSPELCKILGLPVGTEMTSDDASLLFDERDRPVIMAKLEAAQTSADEGKWNGVVRLRRADGGIRWVSIHGRRYYRNTAAGRCPVRSVGTVIDITVLREAEEALRQSEVRLRLALEAAQMGTFEADLSGEHARIDEQEAHLLGLPEGTRVVSRAELRERIPFEDLRASDAKKERLTERNESYHHEFRLRMPDGSIRWLSAYAAIRLGRIFGVSFDVTQRKIAEDLLRESEARLRIATNGAALGVFEWDVQADRTVWENERMYEIFGHTRADGPLSKRRLVEEYLHPDDREEFKAALAAALQTNGNFHAIYRIKTKGGAQRWLQTDGKVEGGAGGSQRLVGVVADITARKALERRATKLSERLMTLQEEERRRIAQELHDSTAQHLVAAGLNLMVLRQKTNTTEALEKLWDEAEASMQEALRELRTFSYLMHPPALHASGLRATLRQYVAGFSSRSGLEVALKLSEKVDGLPLGLQRSLFRIVQEALANVHRHASATHATVGLRWIGGRLHLIVSDNGRGADPSTGNNVRFRPGMGIRGIRMRLDQFGGSLRIRTGPRGTTVHAIVPPNSAGRRKTAPGATRLYSAARAPCQRRPYRG